MRRHGWIIALGIAVGLSVQATTQIRYEKRYENIAAGATVAVASLFKARLTTETGVSVSTSDRSAQTTLYLTPHDGDQIALYDGSAWAYFTVAEESLDISGCSATTPYDVFVVDDSGVTLEHVAWTNDTTRATAINDTTDGIWTKTGDATRRYVGTYYCNGAGETDDTENVRYVWNHHNRQPRKWRRDRADSTHFSSPTGVWRQAGGVTANRAQVVFGQPDGFATMTYNMGHYDYTNNYVGIGFGLDSTTTLAGNTVSAWHIGSSIYFRTSAQYAGAPGIGQHDLNLIEYKTGAGTWNNYGNEIGSGAVGWVEG
jgi:hypothetical protein